MVLNLVSSANERILECTDSEMTLMKMMNNIGPKYSLGGH